MAGHFSHLANIEVVHPCKLLRSATQRVEQGVSAQLGIERRHIEALTARKRHVDVSHAVKVQHLLGREALLVDEDTLGKVFLVPAVGRYAIVGETLEDGLLRGLWGG